MSLPTRTSNENREDDNNQVQDLSPAGKVQKPLHHTVGDHDTRGKAHETQGDPVPEAAHDDIQVFSCQHTGGKDVQTVGRDRQADDDAVFVAKTRRLQCLDVLPSFSLELLGAFQK